MRDFELDLEPHQRKALKGVVNSWAKGAKKRMSRSYVPLTVAKEGLAAGRECDALIEGSLDSLQPEIACEKGCSYCCYPPVSATVAEVVNLVVYVQMMGGELEERCRERVEATYQATKEMTARERYSQSLPCPFLEDGECSVYDARPLSCRGYNSLNVDACRQGHENPSSPPPVPAFTPQLLWSRGLKNGVAKALRQQGLNPITVDLTKAAHRMWDDPVTVVEGWLEKQPVFEGCEPFAL